jgi:hypothetical protein
MIRWSDVLRCVVVLGAVGIPEAASADNSETAVGIYCDPTHDKIEISPYLIWNQEPDTSGANHWDPRTLIPFVHAAILSGPEDSFTWTCRTRTRTIVLKASTSWLTVSENRRQVTYKMIERVLIDGTAEYRLRSSKKGQWQECVADNPLGDDVPPALRCGPLTVSDTTDPDDVEQFWK